MGLVCGDAGGYDYHRANRELPAIGFASPRSATRRWARVVSRHAAGPPVQVPVDEPPANLCRRGCTADSATVPLFSPSCQCECIAENVTNALSRGLRLRSSLPGLLPSF
jgi:hypothetical protein